jgi:hypothetical protein
MAQQYPLFCRQLEELELDQAEMIMGAALSIGTGSDTATGIIIRANSGIQASDLQQWQNAAGSVLATITASGQVIVGSAIPSCYSNRFCNAIFIYYIS